jgi:hypothetical protein
MTLNRIVLTMKMIPVTKDIRQSKHAASGAFSAAPYRAFFY